MCDLGRVWSQTGEDRMIRDVFPAFIKRLGDYVAQGRNRARIVVGTDRKDTLTSGYGEGGKDDPQSGTIDIVAGFSEANPSMQADLSRIYVSGKTDPDDNFGVNVGEKAVGVPAVVAASENVYVIGRKTVKILVGDVALVITEQDIQIIAQRNISITAGSTSITLDQNGNILLGSDAGAPSRILTEQDICVGTDPVTGGPIVSSFLRPDGAAINNQLVKIKI